MLDTLFATSSTTESLSPVPFLACVAVALGLGLVLSLIYCFRSRHTQSFATTLAVLPAIVCVVIAMVNGNVGAGVAVAGAFSLVRFRSVAGSARDIGFIFLAMAVGLVCGMGYLGYAALTTAVIGGAYLVLQLSGLGIGGEARDRTLRITVPEDLDYSTLFDDVLDRFATHRELVSVRTTNMGSLYKLTYNVSMAGGMSERAFLDELRCRNGNLEVSLSLQETPHEEL